MEDHIVIRVEFAKCGDNDRGGFVGGKFCADYGRSRGVGYRAAIRGSSPVYKPTLMDLE